MSNEEMRKEFEKWLSEKYGKHMISKWSKASQDYNQLACTIAFEAYKAGIDSIRGEA